MSVRDDLLNADSDLERAQVLDAAFVAMSARINNVQTFVDIVGGATAGDVTVSGITTTDTLIAVVQFEVSGSNVTSVVNLTSEFTITEDDTINNTGGTDTTGDFLQVTWSRTSAG